MLRRHNLSPFTQSKKSKILPLPLTTTTTTSTNIDESLFESLDDLVSLWEQRLAKSTTSLEQHDQHETFDEHKKYNAVPPAVPDLNVDDEDEDDGIDRSASSSAQNMASISTDHLLSNEQASNVPEASPQMVTGFPNSTRGEQSHSHRRTSQDYTVGSLGIYMAYGSPEVQKSFPEVHDQIDLDIMNKMKHIEHMMKDRKKNQSKSTLAKVLVVDEMKKDNNMLQTEIKRLLEVVSTLDSRISYQDNTIEFIKSEMCNLLISNKTEEEELSKELDLRDATIANLKNSFKHMSERNSSLEDELERLRAENTKLQVKSLMIEEKAAVVEEEMRKELQLAYIENSSFAFDVL